MAGKKIHKSKPAQEDIDARLEILWKHFVGRRDAFIVEDGGWHKKDELLSKEFLGQHLAGQLRLGSYPLSAAGFVPWLCHDLDVHGRPEAKPSLQPTLAALYDWYTERGVLCLLEDTGGEGYHAWILFLCAVPASKVIRLGQKALRETGSPLDMELFPKQAKAKYGNAVRLPWGRHKSGQWSKFIDKDLTPLDDVAVIKRIQEAHPTTEADLDKIIPPARAKGEKATGSQKGIAPERWEGELIEGRRHNSLYAIACELRARKFRPESVLTELRTHNKARCRPPLGDDEVCQIWESAMKTTGVTEIQADGESQADVLVKIALEKTNLFHTPENKGYVAFSNNGRRETWALKSPGFKQWLSREAYQRFGRVPYSEAIRTALDTLEGIACYDNEKRDLQLRVAWHDHALWYDLGDWTAVKATEEGWAEEEEPPIIFRHYDHQKVQVHPQRDGDLRLFLKYVNVEKDVEVLVLTYLVVSLVPDIPQVILLLQGPQGSGKSVALRLIQELVDPSLAGLLTMPPNEGEFAQRGYHHRAVYVDNVRAFHKWLPEAFCRFATGATFIKRALWTDEGDVLLTLKGLGGLSCISLEVDAPDFLDRGLSFSFRRIPDENRRGEEELLRDFEQDQPRILGGLFDALSKAMKLRKDIKIPRLPRMADYYCWCCAAALALGYRVSDFEEAFLRNIEYQSREALEASILAPVVQEMMEGRDEWKGTLTDLLMELNTYASEQVQRVQEWPKAPNWLSRKVRGIIPILAQVGIKVEEERTRDKKVWAFRRVGKNTVATVTPSAPQAELDRPGLVTIEENLSSQAPGLSSHLATIETIGDDKEKKYRHIQPQLGGDDRDDKISSLEKEVDIYTPEGVAVRYPEMRGVWHSLGSPPIPIPGGRIKDLDQFLSRPDVNVEIVGIAWAWLQRNKKEND